MGNPLRNLDIAPQEVVSIRIDPSDTVKNITIDGIYIPSSISWKYDPRKLMLIPSMEFTGLVNGVPGDTVLIPDVAYDFDDDFDFNFDFNIPPFPPIDIPVLVITNPLATETVVILVKDYGIFYTDDFTSDSPSWYPCNFGLPSLDIQNVEMTASGRLYCQIGKSYIYTAEYVGAAWGKLFDASIDIGNPESYPFPRGHGISGFGVDRDADDSIIIIAGLVVTIFSTNIQYAWIGSSAGVTRSSSVFLSGMESDFSGVPYAFITKGRTGLSTVWNMTYNRSIGLHAATLPANGSVISTSILLNPANPSVINTRSKESPNVLIAMGDSVISYDNGGTWLDVSGTASSYNQVNDRFQSIITNDTGTQIVRGIASNPGLVYSKNSGATWSSGSYANQVSSVWHLGLDHYLFSGESGSVSGLYNLNTTPQIVDKTGNLRNIITGSFSIEVIRSYE
jgi:hypothetical protein